MVPHNQCMGSGTTPPWLATFWSPVEHPDPTEARARWILDLPDTYEFASPGAAQAICNLYLVGDRAGFTQSNSRENVFRAIMQGIWQVRGKEYNPLTDVV
jgi:hypothetical protein